MVRVLFECTKTCVLMKKFNISRHHFPFVDVLVGGDWGDEGKGKIVDYLLEYFKYDAVIRWAGGANAGHTIYVGGKQHVLHLLPSSIFHKKVKSVLGNDMVIDPVALDAELAFFDTHDRSVRKRLFIAKGASLTLPTHRYLDKLYETLRGKDKIDTTLRGIGPTYTDRTARRGLLISDLEDLELFRQKVDSLVSHHWTIIEAFAKKYKLNLSFMGQYKADMDAFWKGITRLRTLQPIDIVPFMRSLQLSGATVLAEGAQGFGLDLSHGSVPDVTSSHPITPGAIIGLGISHKNVRKTFVLGKAYCTRVGSGYFPSEYSGDENEALRQKGGEFGATTGRPRRCGARDLPHLASAALMNGADYLVITKLDILSGGEDIKVLTAYAYDENYQDKYEVLPGWKQDISHVRTWRSLPKNAKAYVRFIEESIGVPVYLISVGPESDAVIRVPRYTRVNRKATASA